MKTLRAKLQFPRLPWYLSSKEFTCNVEDLGSIPRLRRSPGEGKGYPLEYPGLKNSKDCIVLGVEKSRTRLGNFHFTSLHFTSLEISQRKQFSLKTVNLVWVFSLLNCPMDFKLKTAASPLIFFQQEIMWVKSLKYNY